MDNVSSVMPDMVEEAEIEAAKIAKPDQAQEEQPDKDAMPPEAKRLYAQPEDTVEIRGNVMTSANSKPAKSTGARFDIKI